MLAGCFTAGLGLGNLRAIDDIPAGQTFLIQGNAAVGHANVRSSGFEIFGTLRLESANGGFASTLTLTNGVLTNAVGGTVEVNPGSGGTRTLIGDVFNHGSFLANYGLTLGSSGARFVNDGAFTIAGGQTVTVSGPSLVFDQNGGTLGGEGGLRLQNARFNYNGGSVSLAAPYMINSTLAIGPDGKNPAAFMQTGSGSVLLGDVWPGETVWVRGDSTGGHTTATAPTGFRNYGTLQLESRDGGFTTAFALGEGTLTNMSGGVISVNPGSGGARVITGNLLNQGTFQANYGLTLQTEGGVYANEGAFTIAAGQTLTISGRSQTFSQNAGVLTSDGLMRLIDITFNFNGGAISGMPYLIDSDLVIAPEAGAAASFLMTGSGSVLRGDIRPGQTVWLRGDATGGHTTVTSPTGFRNYGTLQLESRDGGWTSSFALGGGTLTNMSGGVISVNPGAGGPRVITGNLLNQGTFQANYGLTLQTDGGAYVNEGAFTIAAGQTLTVTARNQTFSQNAGVLTSDGLMRLNDITFNFNGGAISGTPYLINSDLVIGPEAGAAASFLMTGPGSVLRGDIRAGQTVWVSGDGTGGHTTATAPTGFRNYGTLQLGSRDGGWTSSFALSEGTLTNMAGGVISVNPGSGGPRVIKGNLLNQGTFQADYGMTLSTANGVYNNEAAFTIAEGRILSINALGQVFNQNAGVLKVDGGMELTDIQFNFNGGTITGTPYLINSDLTLGPDAIEPASFLVTGSGSVLRGDIRPGQFVWVIGHGRGSHTKISIPQGIRNGGRLLLESRDAGYASGLAVADGMLINGPSGVIDINAGTGGARPFEANLLNQGAVNVNWHSDFNRASGAYENAGQFRVAEGITLRVLSGNPQFTQSGGLLDIHGGFNLYSGAFTLAGGALTNSGGFYLETGTFNFTGGSMGGNALGLNASTLNVGPDAVSPIGLTLGGASTLNAAAIQPGQTVWVAGGIYNSHTTLTVPNGFVSHGRFLFESRNAGYTSGLTLSQGVLTNAPDGVIDFNTGTGGARPFSANLLNQGIVNVNFSANFNKAGGVLVNEGSVNVAGGQVLTIAGSFVQVAGATRLNGATLSAAGGVTLQGGTLAGTGAIPGSLVNGGGVNMGDGGGVLTVGAYTQTAPGVLVIKVGGLAAGTEYDQLRVSGAATLGGKLRVLLAGGYVPLEGDSFTVVTGAGLSGGFASLDLPPLASGLGWRASGVGGGFTLSVVANAGAAFHISGVVKNSLEQPLAGATVFAARTNWTGLRGEYYDNADFTNLKVVRVDPQVDFNWGGGSPDPAIIGDTFSVRWTGQVVPRYTETYTFITVADDGTRLWINDVPLIDDWTLHAPTERNGTIALQAGESYRVRLEYFENGGGAVAQLLWSSPSQAREFIPASQLTPSSVDGVTVPPRDLLVANGATGADGRYQLDVAPDTWAVGVGALATLGYSDPPVQVVTVTASDQVADFVAAPFSGQYYVVTAGSNPAAAGTTTGGGTYADGAIVTLSATPDTSAAPWQFVDWRENGLVQSTSRQFSFALTRNRQLVANFALPVYPVRAENNPPEAGTVSGTGNYTHGANARLVAQPRFGYRLENWTEAGQVIGTGATLDLTITGPRSVVANYAEANLSHTVTTATAPPGLATVTGAGVYGNRESATITAPNVLTNGPLVYTFRRFLLNGGFFGAEPSFTRTFSTVDPVNLNFVAEYEGRSLLPWVVSAQANLNNPVPAGANLVLTFRFDRTMSDQVEPLVVLTNPLAAVQVSVPTGGAWLQTVTPNDTYRTPAISLNSAVDGRNEVSSPTPRMWTRMCWSARTCWR
jgi:hypothetical protein